VRIKLYGKPEKVGWLGWIEAVDDERTIGFVRLDGTIKWGLGKTKP